MVLTLRIYFKSKKYRSLSKYYLSYNLTLYSHRSTTYIQVLIKVHKAASIATPKG